MKNFIGLRHGSPTVPETAPGAASLAATSPEFTPIAAPANQATIAEKDRSLSIFAFLFPAADEFIDKDWAAALDALGDAMVEATDDSDGESDIPAVMTYLGQFIDHDITLNTNSDDVIVPMRIDKPAIHPQNRALVRTAIRNLRSGRLDLDSVYGDSPVPDPENARLQQALRQQAPGDTRKLRVGANQVFTPPAPSPRARPNRPMTPAGEAPRADLPRLGDLVGPGLPFASTANLPESLRPGAGDTFGAWKRKAFIGDGRNDENIILAQLHVAFLRFHNAVVDKLGPTGTFAEARRQTLWHYQWLVVNAYLPAVCDPAVVAAVVAAGAPLYDGFLASQKQSGGVEPGHLPLPFEFSTAAFRFGHSMVRGEYDYNLNFNPAGIPGSLQLMFDFTGNRPVRTAGDGTVSGPIGIGSTERLEENWIIEWERFTSVGPGIQRARKIDSHVARLLLDLPNEGAGQVAGLLKNLARRNLRRGMVHNLAPAQAILDALAARGIPLQRLTPAQLAIAGSTVVAQHGFDTRTPLWFYILKEAEHLGGGNHLGPLGSRIVAETLIGLIDHDPGSYWFAPTGHGGRWSPADGVRPAGIVPDTLDKFFAAAGV